MPVHKFPIIEFNSESITYSPDGVVDIPISNVIEKEISIDRIADIVLRIDEQILSHLEKGNTGDHFVILNRVEALGFLDYFDISDDLYNSQFGPVKIINGDVVDPIVGVSF